MTTHKYDMNGASEDTDDSPAVERGDVLELVGELRDEASEKREMAADHSKRPRRRHLLYGSAVGLEYAADRLEIETQ